MKGKIILWFAMAILVMIAGSGVPAQAQAAGQTALPPPSQADGSVAAEEAQIPSLTESVLPSLSRIAISLCVIVAIIYLTVFLLRKLSGKRIGGKKGTAIQIIEQTYLAPKKSVCLLKLADRAVLVGITENRISMLTEMEWETLPQASIENVGRTQAGFPGFLSDAAGKLFGGKRAKGAEHESAV
jgi:flagellar biosynthetic protein FliO